MLKGNVIFSISNALSVQKAFTEEVLGSGVLVYLTEGLLRALYRRLLRRDLLRGCQVGSCALSGAVHGEAEAE